MMAAGRRATLKPSPGGTGDALVASTGGDSDSEGTASGTIRATEGMAQGPVRRGGSFWQHALFWPARLAATFALALLPACSGWGGPADMTEAEMDRPIASGADLARRLHVLHGRGTLANESFVARLLRFQPTDRVEGRETLFLKFEALDTGSPLSQGDYRFSAWSGRLPGPSGELGMLGVRVATPQSSPEAGFCLAFDDVLAAFGPEYQQGIIHSSMPPLGQDLSYVAIDYGENRRSSIRTRFFFFRFRCVSAVSMYQNTPILP